MRLFPYCHFERTREIFFVRGKTKDVRIAASGKHRPPSDWGSRRFLQAALRRKKETGNEKDPSAALGMTKRGNVSSHFFLFRGSQPPLLRGTSFRRKEEETRMPLLPYCHFRGKRYENAASPLLSFRANARNLFRLRSRRSGRKAENGKHRASCDWGSRCFMQTALRRKKETGNEKDPSAALGMTKRGNAFPYFFLFRGSRPPPLRGTSFQGKEGEAYPSTKAFRREKGSDTRIPLSPYCHFERKREIFFVCGQEEAREQRKTGNTVLPATGTHGASFGQLYEGKRKTGNEKDPSAALGMTKRGNVSSHFFLFYFHRKEHS